MTIKSFPKVNLFLLTREKKQNKKLHKIYSLFYLIESIYDELKIEIARENKINYVHKNKIIKLHDCIILKTINILKKENILESNVFFKITINKNIPMFSGLGSGSSNAAAFISYLIDNNIIKESKKLYKLIPKIGSDVMFFLKKIKIGFVYSYGDKVIKLKNRKINIKLILTNVQCSTKKVFDNINKQNPKHSFLKQLFYFKIKKYGLLINELEKSCFNIYPELQKIKDKYETETGRKIYLSGTGGTLFTID